MVTDGDDPEQGAAISDALPADHGIQVPGAGRTDLPTALPSHDGSNIRSSVNSTASGIRTGLETLSNTPKHTRSSKRDDISATDLEGAIHDHPGLRIDRVRIGRGYLRYRVSGDWHKMQEHFEKQQLHHPNRAQIFHRVLHFMRNLTHESSRESQEDDLREYYDYEQDREYYRYRIAKDPREVRAYISDPASFGCWEHTEIQFMRYLKQRGVRWIPSKVLARTGDSEPPFS